MEKEIIKTFKNKLIEKYPNSEPRYFAMFEIVVYNQKIYFPNYEYFSMHTEPYDLKLQNYSSPSYCVVSEILKEVELPLPVAQEGNNVICKCLNDSFHFSYGGYSLSVECNKCGNEWSAYSG